MLIFPLLLYSVCSWRRGLWEYLVLPVVVEDEACLSWAASGLLVSWWRMRERQVEHWWV